jgi:hypothetical protein
MQKVINFKRLKETKNTVRFEEEPEDGQPPVMGTLYIQKWFVKDRDQVRVSIDLDEDRI